MIRFLFLFFILFLSSSLHSEIVSLDLMPPTHSDKGWYSRFEFGFSGKSGNVNSHRYKTNFRIDYLHPSWHCFSLLQNNVDFNNSVKIDERIFFHLRTIYTSNHDFQPEFFYQMTQENFQNLSLRLLLGGGIRHTCSFQFPFLEWNSSHMWGLGLCLEKEFYSLSPSQKTVRVNSYLSLQLMPSDTLSHNFSLYFQPSLDNFKRYRIATTFLSSFSLSNSLSLNLRLTIDYDSHPQFDTSPYDLRYTTNFSFHI